MSDYTVEPTCLACGSGRLPSSPGPVGSFEVLFIDVMLNIWLTSLFIMVQNFIQNLRPYSFQLNFHWNLAKLKLFSLNWTKLNFFFFDELNLFGCWAFLGVSKHLYSFKIRKHLQDTLGIPKWDQTIKKLGDYDTYNSLYEKFAFSP